MEIRFDQLFVLLLVIFFTLLDVGFRWLRRRRAQPAETPPPRDEDIVFEDEDLMFEGESGTAVPEPADVERIVPAPAPTPPPLVRQVPQAIRPPAPSMRRRGVVLHPADARRAIVWMTILGPCRGVE